MLDIAGSVLQAHIAGEKKGSWVESVGNLKGIREGLVKVKGRHWTTTQDTAGFAWS